MNRDATTILADIDSFDVDRFVAHLTPDVTFRFGNADPIHGRDAVREAATRFATGIVGLELAAPTEPGVAHLRADHRHHCLALVQGPSGVISSGFTVAGPDALAAAETELERSGTRVYRGSPAAARSRRVREFIAFDDPFGNRLELVTDQVHTSTPSACAVSTTKPPGSRAASTRTSRARSTCGWGPPSGCPPRAS